MMSRHHGQHETHACLLIGAWMMAILPASLAAQISLPASFPFQIVAHSAVGADLANGLISDAAVAPSGRVCQADYSNQRITCFAPDGRMLWRAGRKGEGPGEFRAVYRLTLDVADTVYAFDIASSDVSVIAPNGNFVRRNSLSLRFRQVDDILAGPNRTLLVSGVAPLAGAAADSAVHVFQLGDSITYVRSFGALPPAQGPDVLAYWGAGGIRLMPDGSVLYGRRFPYEIYDYLASGQLVRTLRGPVKLVFGPDDAIRIVRTASSTYISNDTTKNIIVPLTPIAVTSQLILTGRRAKDGTIWWDVLSLEGQTSVATYRFPLGQHPGALIGIDRNHLLLWAVDNDSDEPSLVRLTYQLRASR